MSKEIADSTSHQVEDEVTNSRKLKQGWPGGTLNDYLCTLPKGIDAETKLPLSGFITKLTFPIDGKEHSAYRLTGRGSEIIRGIMKKVDKLHRRGVSHGDLNSHNIILDHNYRVKLVGSKYVKVKNCMQKDWRSLSQIIREILRDGPIPLDVKGLIYLLVKYCRYAYERWLMIGHNYQSDACFEGLFFGFCRENHDIVFDHPCLWTPMERIANILVFRSEMGASPDTKEVWSNANCVNEEKTNWTEVICKHDVYRRALDKWIEELKKRPKHHNMRKRNEYKELSYIRKEDQSCIGDLKILSFFRMCFNHIHHAQNSRLLQTEEELYVIFPEYLANFLKFNQTQKLITSIYKTEC